MTVKKRFRFELTFKVDINVEKIKESDYGRKRFSKQLLNHLLNDPEAVRTFMIIYFFDHYFNDAETEITSLLDTGEKEDFYILRAAKKCPPEAQSFFNDLLTGGEINKKGDKGPVFGSDEAIENERLFEYLQSKLSNIVPVKANFCELPAESITNNHNPVKIKKRKMKKTRPVTHDNELSPGDDEIKKKPLWQKIISWHSKALYRLNSVNPGKSAYET